MLRKSISDYGCVSGGRPRFVQSGTVAPNFWGGRRGEHKEKCRVQQGSRRKSQVLEVKGRGGGGAKGQAR